jgi:hypothetical protein
MYFILRLTKTNVNNFCIALIDNPNYTKNERWTTSEKLRKYITLGEFTS